jgi:hypothetical protein
MDLSGNIHLGTIEHSFEAHGIDLEFIAMDEFRPGFASAEIGPSSLRLISPPPPLRLVFGVK